MIRKVKHIIVVGGVFLSSVVALGGVILMNGVSAIITHETHSDVQFTFRPTLGLTLTGTPTGYSDATFLIDGLAQNLTALSNVVNAGVTTNSSAGYTLSATVGGTDSTSTSHPNKRLTSSSHTDYFEMIDDTLSSSLSAGEWGFTLDNGTTYKTLALYTDTLPTVINRTVNIAGSPDTGYIGDTSHAGTNMQIGAYAKSNQKTGSYSNVINFTAIANVQMRTVTVAANNADVASVSIVSVDGNSITPVTSGSWGEGTVLGIEATCASGKNFFGWGISGDFGRIANRNSATTTYTIGGDNVTLTAYCGTLTAMQDVTPSMCLSTPTTVKDARDNKVYTIARLADGQCWMTSNLNLVGETGGTPIYSDTSDVPAGYPESGGVPYYTLPASSQTGFNSTTDSFVYNTGNETTDQADCYANHPCNSYYSWLAATAGGKDASDTVMTDDGYNAAYSICPKGWRLPTATTSNAPAMTSPNWKTGDFYKVATAYGANLESNYRDSAATFYNNAGPGTTPNLLLTGLCRDSTCYDSGEYGHFWSSTSRSSGNAYYLAVFRSSHQDGLSHIMRNVGFPIRCVLR